MQLDAEAARTAVQVIADGMGLPSAEDAAEGILAIVNENMAGALRVVSVQRGHDPREFALVAYGGAGPMHANAVARIMGSFPVIVPPAPGLLCALGDIVADFRDEFARTYIRVLEDAEPEDVASILEELGGRAPAMARGRGHRRGSCAVSVVLGRHAVSRPGLRDPGRARRPRRCASEGLGQLDPALQRASRAALRLPYVRDAGARSSTYAPSASGAGPSPSCPRGRGGGHRRIRPPLWKSTEIILRGWAPLDEDLRPVEAEPVTRSRSRGRDRVRRHHGRPTRSTGPRSTRHFNILVTPSAEESDDGNHATTLRIAEIPTDVEVDPVTLDIIEGALKNARFEMDAVLFRSAMSPVIREQHDEFPMITDPNGRMVVGQFGAYINEMMADWEGGIYPGDVILTSDPFKCSASISHTNDWLVLRADLFRGRARRLVEPVRSPDGCGGPLPGSLPTGARTIFEEGLIIPPLKIIERGEHKDDVLKLIFNNMRLPEMNRADLFAIVAGCRAGERCVVQLCERFGKERTLPPVRRCSTGRTRPCAR